MAGRAARHATGADHVDMPQDYVGRLFSALTDSPAPDTPDRAALTRNPLAIPGL